MFQRTQCTRCPGAAASPPMPRRGHAAAACILAFVLALVAGCASPPGPRAAGASPPAAADDPPAPPSAPSRAEQRTAFAEAMSIEAQWLRAWFRDTPVRIAQGADGQLAVEVPREFCFERGRADVQPPLGAVLDKLAELMRRRPATRLVRLAAPGDDAGSRELAMQRAARVQRHLRNRGLPPARLGDPAAGSGVLVQLRLGPAESAERTRPPG